jgi:hypothetical protein
MVSDPVLFLIQHNFFQYLKNKFYPCFLVAYYDEMLFFMGIFLKKGIEIFLIEHFVEKSVVWNVHNVPFATLCYSVDFTSPPSMCPLPSTPLSFLRTPSPGKIRFLGHKCFFSVLWNRNYFFTVPVMTFDKLRFRFRLLKSSGFDSDSGSVSRP